MIRIYDGEVFTLDTNTYNRVEILQNSLHYSKLDNLKFIVYEYSRIKCTLSIDDIINGTPLNDCTITIGPNMFIEAEQIFSSKASVSCIPVLDNNGQCLFLLEYYNDAIITGTNDSVWYKPMYFEPDIFIDNTYDYLDLSMFDTVDHVFIFNLEQYTHRIIQVLLKHKPDIRIFCTDTNISLFFTNDEVTSLDNIYELREYTGSQNTMYIYSDYVFPQTIVPANILNIYCSYQILNSIFTIKKISHHGELHPDKTIYLINPPTNLHGLVDIMKYVYAHSMYAIHHNWIPVVDLSTQPNGYIQNNGDNMWEYFFSPLSNISVQDAYNCKNVINLHANNLRLNEELYNIHMRCTINTLYDYKQDSFNNLIQLNRKTKKYCSCNIPSQFNDNSRILGVIMRGTDYRKTSKNATRYNNFSQDIEVVIKRANELISIWNYSYVYLETEETEYVERFKQEYGDRLLFTEQKRITYHNDFDSKYVLELIDLDGNNTTLQYLTAIYALSKCNGLITSIFCGPYLLSNLWKEGEYEVREIVVQHT